MTVAGGRTLCAPMRCWDCAERVRPVVNGSNGAGLTLASYFGAFAPVPDWEEVVSWPPDVFALANLVLDHTESYRFVVAPCTGRRWPPLPDWTGEVRSAAREWAEAGRRCGGELPALVRRSWETVARHRDVALEAIRNGEAGELNEALLTLHAAADETCAEVAASGRSAPAESFEHCAWRLLHERGSLSRLSPTRVRVVPKTHLSAHGITIRSLSRHLALCYEAVDVRWRSVELAARPATGEYSIVLAPWPFKVSSRDFRPTAPPVLENMDTNRYGFFEFSPEQAINLRWLRTLLQAALGETGRVDVLVLPEGAVGTHEVAGVEQTLDDHGVSLLIAGVRQPPRHGAFGRNYLHFGARGPAGWLRYEQDKHHRWFLDETQLRQYHLTRSLAPKKLWWEAIDIRARIQHIIDIGGGLTVAPLVCEDLARLDEVADLVRRIGPSLVVSLLLDGPQISARWPCRYASILVDEPGSTVLTLTSYGMVARCRPPGRRRSRAIAHWHDRHDGLREIELARGSAGVLLSASLESRTLWTADGRFHAGVPGLALRDVRQLPAVG